MQIIKISQYTFYKEKIAEKYVFVESGDIEGYIKEFLIYQYDEEKDVYEDFINLLMTTKEETFEAQFIGETTFEIIEVEKTEVAKDNDFMCDRACSGENKCNEQCYTCKEIFK